MDGEMGQRAIGYLVGIIITAVGGSYVQLKYTCTEYVNTEDPYDMMK